MLRHWVGDRLVEEVPVRGCTLWEAERAAVAANRRALWQQREDRWTVLEAA